MHLHLHASPLPTARPTRNLCLSAPRLRLPPGAELPPLLPFSLATTLAGEPHRGGRGNFSRRSPLARRGVCVAFPRTKPLESTFLKGCMRPPRSDGAIGSSAAAGRGSGGSDGSAFCQIWVKTRAGVAMALATASAAKRRPIARLVLSLRAARRAPSIGGGGGHGHGHALRAPPCARSFSVGDGGHAATPPRRHAATGDVRPPPASWRAGRPPMRRCA